MFISVVNTANEKLSDLSCLLHVLNIWFQKHMNIPNFKLQSSASIHFPTLHVAVTPSLLQALDNWSLSSGFSALPFFCPLKSF